VVTEETVRHAAHPESCEPAGKQVEERAVIIVIGEDAGFVVPASEHVVHQAGDMQAQWATHCQTHRQDIGPTEVDGNRVVQAAVSGNVARREMRALNSVSGLFVPAVPSIEDTVARNKI
jgi:hypothetical protein